MNYSQAKKLLRDVLTSDEIYDLVGDQFGTDRVPTWEAQDYLTDLATDLEYILPQLAQLRSGMINRIHLIYDTDLGDGEVIWLHGGEFRVAPCIFSSVGPASTMALPDLLDWLRDKWTAEVYADD